MNPISIYPNLFNAAAAGDAETFKRNTTSDEIESLLTAQTKNTILHINIISQKRKNGSTKFIGEMLEICPSLLLQVNAKGDTPLHLATKFAHSNIVSFLIERAKLAAWQMMRMTNNEKNTALHEAVCHGNVQVVKILTKQDPDSPYSANKYGKTPLYMVAEGRYSEMVIELLENCTSVSHEGPNGKTALHAAAMHFYFVEAALKKLLEKKMGLIKETDHYGWTPIHYAAYYNQYQQIHVLLENDQTAADIADKDRKMTALHLAAGQGHARTVETILFLDPKCYELVDHRGWNFLHYAMVSFKFHELKILLKNPLARSLIDEGDNNGNTPLHVLAAIRPKEFFKIKVRYDAGGNYGAVNKQNVSVTDVLIYGSRELTLSNVNFQEEVRNLSKDNGRGQYPDGVICKRAQVGINKLGESRKDS
ncbi:ankyrin repeat-containing protein At5g02620 [Citrus clementina]|nr:ankyrin repeat-containing protein At5g02620 [Citrus x clementina]